jgi:hypothetical protein
VKGEASTVRVPGKLDKQFLLPADVKAAGDVKDPME